MKKFYSFFVCLIAVLSVQAQSQIEMAVAIPRQTTDFSHDTWNVIRNKLVDNMTNNGISSFIYSGIIVYPEIIVLNKQVVEGGMHNITILNIQLNLKTEHVITGTIFNSLTFELQGEGANLDKAVTQAINKLRSTDNQLNDFMIQSKNRILQYYQDNTNMIIQKAFSLASTNQYEAALALLSSYPASVSGCELVSKALTEVYGQYQNSMCSQKLQQARLAYSLGNYEEAVSWLQQVDIQSSCAAEARALCQRIKSSRDAEAARELAILERAYQSETELEKQRIKAVRDIAVAYFKSTPQFYYIF